ncbi:MAG: prolyl oligopeptidase family serine peptidase [Nevskiales bacterium]|nr:prolyl oligopeptidase family serine peptidase [Nevskiales bacterium]
MAGTAAAAAAAFEYPPSPRGTVVDDYHGTKVADPYRWLEETDSSETVNWVKAQNRLTFSFLEDLPDRGPLRRRLTALWDHERYGVPQREAGRLFFTRNNGLQNQSVLYVQDSEQAQPRALLDPNELSRTGTVALTQWKVSPDARYLAYGLAQSGSDWNEFRVREVASGRDTGDRLTRIKFSSIAWTRDSRGFYYSRYPEPSSDNPTAGPFETLAHQKLYYHRLGTPQSEDRLIVERPDEPHWGFSAEVTDDGLFCFITIEQGTDRRNRLYYQYLGPNPRTPKVDSPVAKLVDAFEASYTRVGNEGPVVYLLTDKNAPNKRVIAVDLRAPAPQYWITLIPEGPDPIRAALHAGRQFVVVALHDASHRLRRYTLDGQPQPELKMPGLGSVTETSSEGLYLHGQPGSSELFYSFTSYHQPPTNYRCDLARGRCAAFLPAGQAGQTPVLGFKPADYVTEQVFYTSKDGTRIPLFISHKKDWTPSQGPRPTLLYGYGGFEQALTPSFSVPALAWMEQGGLYAVANLRGGGEYGSAWHSGGIRERKQNGFDDFIAAAEHLIGRRYTTSQQLAVHGRSNGGLLVGAVLNQRPELFAAALPAVGVMDMLRFHTFTIGWAWTDDYGSPDNPQDFKTLRAYSPYHNVKSGTKYPAALITTADHDDRVVPGHSFKYAAALQAAQAGDKPVLIRIETQAGHGAGKPTTKLIEEWTDQLAFITHFTRVRSAQ